MKHFRLKEFIQTVYDLQCPLVLIMLSQWSQLQLSRDLW